MASQVAWLSFDAEQQRRTQLMMMALAEQSTVDELGLGTIRDLISAVLHPGMTVLLSRARYLVFVPRIYRSLSSSTVDGLLAEGRRAEGRLVDQLRRAYPATGGRGEGIIGLRTGENAKQPASTNYWGLLNRLGIVNAPTVREWCSRRVASLDQQRLRSSLRSEDDPDVTSDDLWAELPCDTGGASFDLTFDEAEWLQERFLSTERTAEPDSRSLIVWFLDPARHAWVDDVSMPWHHPDQSQFPAHTAEAMGLGEILDRLVHGARIAYNWLCTVRSPAGEMRDRLDARYREALVTWEQEIDEEGLPGQPELDHLDTWARRRFDHLGASAAARSRWDSTLTFLRAWQRLIEAGADAFKSDKVRELVTGREARLKPGRARLVDPALLTNWAGDAGYRRFDYNWTVARQFLTDIHTGLGTPFVNKKDRA